MSVGVKKMKWQRVLPLVLALVVAVALMVSVSVPAYASSYSYRFIDFSLSSYSIIYGKLNTLLGTYSDTSLSVTNVSTGYVSSLSSSRYLFQQSILTNPYEDTPYLKPSFTFTFPSNMVFQPISGFTYYQISFDVIFPANMQPISTSNLSNYIYLRNSNDDNYTLGSPLNFVEAATPSTEPRWVGSFVFPVSDTYIFNELYLTFYLTPNVLKEYSSSPIDFYFGNIEITEANSLDFQNYVSASLGSVLSALGVSNEYLSDLVTLVTQNNVKLDSIISILNAISSSASNINTKLSTVISLLQTMSSSDATLAQKIEATNQLTQQIQNTLQNGTSSNETENSAAADRADGFQNNVNDYTDAVDSIGRPSGSDIEMDFGELTEGNYNSGFVNSTLGVLYDNKYIGYVLFMVFGYSILGFILFGKRA